MFVSYTASTSWRRRYSEGAWTVWLPTSQPAMFSKFHFNCCRFISLPSLPAAGFIAVREIRILSLSSVLTPTTSNSDISATLMAGLAQHWQPGPAWLYRHGPLVVPPRGDGFIANGNSYFHLGCGEWFVIRHYYCMIRWRMLGKHMWEESESMLPLCTDLQYRNLPFMSGKFQRPFHPVC